MRSSKRQFMRTLVGAAVLSAFAGVAMAQQTVKIGLLATLEGPFAAGGQDGMRGAELAIKQRGGMVAGKKIVLIKASSDAKPDVAVNATRKLVEQDKVDIMVGPLSGGEGIAVKEYSKSQPQVTFINGSSGAQATTLVNPSPNFFRFNTEGAQWMVGLGKAALDKGYKRVMVIAERSTSEGSSTRKSAPAISRRSSSLTRVSRFAPMLFSPCRGYGEPEAGRCGGDER